MKFFIIILFSLTSIISSHPIDYDQIIFPDNNKIDEIVKNIQATKFESKILLDDPNLLKSENTSEEFFYDKKADSKLEHGNHFQGDIVLLDDQKQLLNKTDSDTNVHISTRTGLIWEGYRWPKNEFGRVVVPYEMSGDYSYDDKVRIVLGMNDLQKYTCVQFIKRSYEDDYIYIHSGNGCHSNLGRIGGMQHVSLQRDGCLSRGTVIHEIIHALGYDHMQNHPDRDSYVYILWNNIFENQKFNFKKDSPWIFSNFGTPYDYYSVMHYEQYAFSKNGKPTIVPKDSRFSVVIGQRNALSNGDAKRINNMYECFNDY